MLHKTTLHDTSVEAGGDRWWRRAAGCDREVTSIGGMWVEMSQDLKEGSVERVVIVAMLRSVQRPPCLHRCLSLCDAGINE